MTQGSNEDQSPKSKRSFTLGGGREIVAIIVLLVVFSQVGPLFRPLLFFGAIAFAGFWYIRICFRFGKTAGIAGSAVLAATVLSAIGYQYSCSIENATLDETLAKYDKITIRRSTIFPSSEIVQVSFDNRITDEDIALITTMPAFENVTHVYIDQCAATDKSLMTIDRFAKLSYVSVDSAVITDEAIADFELRHPNCTMIPYGRW